MALDKDEAEQMKQMSDAIIKIEQILEIVVTDVKLRVRTLEKNDEKFKREVETSCQLKTKEIDHKIEKSEDKIYEDMRTSRASLIRMILAVFGLQGAMFGLFIGAIVYMNNEHGSIYNKINDEHREMALLRSTEHKTVVENGTNIKAILKTLDSIDSKFDKMLKKP